MSFFLAISRNLDLRIGFGLSPFILCYILE